jgi:O-antigen/teichoic acid export membrane protein
LTPQKSKYLLNVGSTNFIPVLQAAFTLVTTPLILHSLGKNDYGIWFLFQSIILWLGLARFGFDTTLIRDLAAIREKPVGEETQTLVSSTFYTSFLVLIVLAVSIFSMSQIFGNGFDFGVDKNILFKNTFVIVFVIFVFQFLGSSLESLFYSRDMFYRRNIICVVRNIFQFALIIGVYSLNKLNLIGLAAIVMVAACFEFIALLLVARKIWGFFPSVKKFDLNVIKKMVRPSSGYFVISIAGLVIFRSDNFLIAAFLSVEEVAVYAISYYLLDYTMRFIWNFGELLSPRLSACYYNNQISELKSVFWKMNLVTVSLALAGGLAIYFLGFWFLKIWVSEANFVPLNVLRVFAFTLFFQCVTKACAVFIKAIGKHQPIAWVSCLEAVLKIGVSIVLAQNYGMLGIALGTLIAHLLTTGWFIPYLALKIILQGSMDPVSGSKSIL